MVLYSYHQGQLFFFVLFIPQISKLFNILTKVLNEFNKN